MKITTGGKPGREGELGRERGTMGRFKARGTPHNSKKENPHFKKGIWAHKLQY